MKKEFQNKSLTLSLSFNVASEFKTKPEISFKKFKIKQNVKFCNWNWIFVSACEMFLSVKQHSSCFRLFVFLMLRIEMCRRLQGFLLCFGPSSALLLWICCFVAFYRCFFKTGSSFFFFSHILIANKSERLSASWCKQSLSERSWTLLCLFLCLQIVFSSAGPEVHVCLRLTRVVLRSCVSSFSLKTF